MAVSKSIIVKIKDVPKGENLSEAPEGEILDMLPSHFQERSSILIEPTQLVNIGSQEALDIIHLAQSLSVEELKDFSNLFSKKKINFAWTYFDMPGLDPDLIMHHLSITPGVQPVKQKLCKMHPHVALLVKVELEKLLKVGFIRAINYAERISNIVSVLKADKSIRFFTELRDLNKACLKDGFPLPNIDMIVDMTAGYEMYSLMDGFSGYNQIKIAPEDQEKIAFTCAWGTFCWNVMPFGLKNAGATYQRAVTTIFHDMMHKKMEDYVDDTLVKTMKRSTHIHELGLILDRMERFKLRLNPKKCAFGVTSRKLLHYIISKKGVEVDPEKVQAIMEMPPPKNISQMRSLQGRLQSIRCFISQLADKAQPSTKVLRKVIQYNWDEDCEQHLKQIKDYLSNPHLALGVLLAQ